MSNRTELDALMTQIMEMWGHQDTLFQIIGETNQWDHKHGADWTFADVPYHFAYCNHDLVSQADATWGAICRMRNDLSFAPGPEDVHNWNAQKFAERPSGQTVDESLAELRVSRDEIRDAVADWTDDADLDRPIMDAIHGRQLGRCAHGPVPSP